MNKKREDKPVTQTVPAKQEPFRFKNIPRPRKLTNIPRRIVG